MFIAGRPDREGEVTQRRRCGNLTPTAAHAILLDGGAPAPDTA
jgi:hypothetical protein